VWPTLNAMCNYTKGMCNLYLVTFDRHDSCSSLALQMEEFSHYLHSPRKARLITQMLYSRVARLQYRSEHSEPKLKT
jgi:hypothetical protein